MAELKSERIAMMMTPTELAGIDNWRFENRIGSRAKAMRILIASALAPSQDAETVKALSDALISAAAQCDRWASESRVGGWSTHQVDANRKLADDLRRAALAGSAS